MGEARTFLDVVETRSEQSTPVPGPCRLVGGLPFLEDPVCLGRSLAWGDFVSSAPPDPSKEQEVCLPLSPGGPAAEEAEEMKSVHPCGPPWSSLVLGWGVMGWHSLGPSLPLASVSGSVALLKARAVRWFSHPTPLWEAGGHVDASVGRSRGWPLPRGRSPIIGSHPRQNAG